MAIITLESRRQMANMKKESCNYQIPAESKRNPEESAEWEKQGHIRAINTYTLPVVTKSAGVIGWPKEATEVSDIKGASYDARRVSAQIKHPKTIHEGEGSRPRSSEHQSHYPG